ncbi:MAG TPA: DUF378 domain-containing protein [Polyangiaceae bacterium]|nr:DUF378 domain-containing protein [Polyangiaceae bacterium]
MDTGNQANLQWGIAAKLFLAVAIIGALNWGLIGFFNFNLVAAIFGDRSAAARVIYALVGLAGIAAIFVTPWGTRRIGEGMHLRRRSTV